MSERTVVGQEYFLKVKRPSPDNLHHQYSRDELLTLAKSPASVRRPKCLEPAYYSEDGKWDPEKWYRAKFCLAREASPLTLGDGKEQRKVSERDRDFRKKSSLNDSVERLKEERDGIVLGPQRRSFGTGCHVQSTTHQYSHQLGLHDREDSRGDRERERDREKPVRKVGSGRIQIERETSLRDSFDDRDHSRDHERERDFNWSRERDRDGRDRDMWDSGGWERDVRDRELRSADRDSRRFERSDRFRGVADRDNSDRDWRDREFRDRGFDKHSRRRNNRGEEKEPEWFTGGPTSQNDTIELRGFDREDNNGDEGSARKGEPRGENKPRVTTNVEDRPIKADVKVYHRSSPEEDKPAVQHEQQEHPQVTSQKSQEEENVTTPQQNSRASPNNKLFDFEEILNAILPLDENGVRQRSRFSRFFSGPDGNMLPCDTSLENMLDPCEGGYPGRAVPSPTSMVGPMGAMQHAHRGMLQFQGQDGEQSKPHTFTLPNNLISVPNSAGDNNATAGKSSLPPSVTALFNRATLGGVSVCKWNPRLDCSVETQESSLLTNSGISSSSSSSFNTQDAEAQLKAMLFGGNRDSTSSSGTASPASLPPGAQRRAKTVAELEADMHSFSPQKYSIPMAPVESIVNPTNSGDVAAFNKLLIMLNAASEANQNMIHAEHQPAHTGYGMVPSHDEFSHAVMRNKEKQIQLQQQSLQNVQRPAPPLTGLPAQLHHQVLHQHMPPPPTSHEQQLTHQLAQSALYQHFQKQQQQMAMNNQKQLADLMNKPPSSPGIPQAMSTPQPNAAMKMRAQNGGSMVSADPILSLIQQNPKIVMNPASPAPHMATILPPQQSAASSTARVPSPLIFNQQPPLHLSAPSPIHAGQLSPRSITMGRNLTPSAMSSPTGMRSPVLPRVLSPQELSAHAQAVMQSALIKKQLQDQSERYLKKQQERAKSPGLQQINVVKVQPAAQPILPPTPQPKGASVDTFTPTSVLRKMHSDKALEKEKQAIGSKKDGEPEYMPSMHELSTGEHADRADTHSQDDVSQKSDAKLRGDFIDISFLDPINPNLVAMTNQLDNQLRAGQTNILPGSLSQPMSVEEKMKLSALAEKPGYLSHIFDKAAAAETARGIHGRPVMRNDDLLQEERNVQQYLLAMQQQLPQGQSGRPVTSCGSKMQMPGLNPVTVQTSMAQFSGMQQNSMSKPMAGRAIVGGSCGFQQSQVPSASQAQNMDLLRFFEQQHLQQQQQQHLRRLQQVSDCQGMVLPPPPLGTPIACLGPPPVVPVPGRIQLVGQPPNPASSAALMHQHIARANAITAHRNQQLPHLMSMQHHNLAPLPPLHTVMTGVSVHLSPHSQTAGPLSPAALSATIQRIASPHGNYKMNGPLQPSGNSGGVPKVDLTSGIQRWFSPDILRTQLPSMPPLPTQGSQVITVDELERN